MLNTRRFFLLQVSLHNGQGMFAHQTSKSMLLPIGRVMSLGKAVESTADSKADCMIEFGHSNVEYTYDTGSNPPLAAEKGEWLSRQWLCSLRAFFVRFQDDCLLESATIVL